MRLFRRQRDAAGKIGEEFQAMLYARLLALALVVGYVIAFVLENGKSVRVRFVFHSTDVSLIWVILLSIALGLIGGLLLAQLDRRRRRRSAGQ
jgi:uncharacterized integral membrane protein